MASGESLELVGYNYAMQNPESRNHSNSRSLIYKPTPLQLSEHSDLRREATRPEHLQDSTYSEKFDSTTIFYDIAVVGDEVILSGPPLLNLQPVLETALVKVDGRSAHFVKTTRLERSQTTIFSFDCGKTGFPDKVEVHIESLGLKVEKTGLKDLAKFLYNKNVLMTLQKNEEIQWIKDWVAYYVHNHGVNAVLLYDNESDNYSAADLVSALESISKLDKIVVVNWNFKYGPQGSPWVGPGVDWDSDFCQIGAFQNCRFHWTNESNGWINADIDELVMSRSNASVFDLLKDSSTGVVGYGGKWIENIAVGLKDGDLPRYWNFPYFSKANCNNKWAMNSSAIARGAHPTAHYVRNIETSVSDDLFIAHYKPLNSGWKIPGRKKLTHQEVPRLLTSDELQVQRNLLEAFSKPEMKRVCNSTLQSSLKSMGIEYPFSEVNSLGWIFNKLAVDEVLRQKWIKSWQWQDTVFVLEYSSEASDVAFDFFLTAESTLAVNAVVRNEAIANSFKSRLRGWKILEKAKEPSSRLGCRIYESKGDEPLHELYEEIINRLNIVFKVMPSKTPFTELQQKVSASQLYKAPLRNLRDASEYDRLADTINELRNDKAVLYVPNHGNWGDALIHRGTEQFLKHRKIPFKTVKWNEFQDFIRTSQDLGITVKDNLVINGGGGAWRKPTSGNLSRAAGLTSVFENVLELPHTYGTGPLDSVSGSMTYFARDKEISLKHIPNATFCHDMAFYLQLPAISKISNNLGVGIFLRKDNERHPLLMDLKSESMDISLLGSHQSQVTPFFELLSNYSEIVTDRMHVAIAGALLDKKVTLITGDYAKSIGVFNASIKPNYPNVELLNLLE